MPGIKHLIQCHCVLPQYRKLDTPIFHKFVVFSRTDEVGDIIPRLFKCNNCGVAHKVVEFCKSEIVYGIEDSHAIVSMDDLRLGIPDKISDILDHHKCDIATWEQVDDIISNKEWGSNVVLSKQSAGGSTQILCLSIDGENSFKVQTHLRQDEIAGKK